MTDTLAAAHRKEIARLLGVKRGAPKGKKKSRAATRFSKQNFSKLLTEKICVLSRNSDIEPTRRAVAGALGLANAKGLDRLRHEFKIAPDWRQFVAEVTTQK